VNGEEESVAVVAAELHVLIENTPFSIGYPAFNQ
jgi:hypothetical protein